MLRTVALAVTSLGSAALLGTIIRLAGSVEALLDALPLTAWALLPFALAFLGLRGHTVTTGRAAGLAGTSGFGLLIYAHLVFAQQVSNGLGFLFIPLWQLIACGVVLALTRGRHSRSHGAG